MIQTSRVFPSTSIRTASFYGEIPLIAFNFFTYDKKLLLLNMLFFFYVEYKSSDFSLLIYLLSNVGLRTCKQTGKDYLLKLSPMGSATSHVFVRVLSALYLSVFLLLSSHLCQWLSLARGK